jgi:amino acid permease
MGVADGYSGKFFGVFLIPIIMSLFFILSKIFINIDPKKDNIKKSETYYNYFILGFIIFFFILQIFSLL